MPRSKIPTIPPIPANVPPEQRVFLQAIADALRFRLGQTRVEAISSPTVEELRRGSIIPLAQPAPTSTSVFNTGSGTLTASATIERAGAQTDISVSYSVSGSVISPVQDPFPVTVTLRRGGPSGTILTTWANISGYSFTDDETGQVIAFANWTGSFIDVDTGRGSTEYYVQASGASGYTHTTTLTVRQTSFS